MKYCYCTSEQNSIKGVFLRMWRAGPRTEKTFHSAEEKLWIWLQYRNENICYCFLQKCLIFFHFLLGTLHIVQPVRERLESAQVQPQLNNKPLNKKHIRGLSSPAGNLTLISSVNLFKQQTFMHKKMVTFNRLIKSSK